MCPLLAGTCTKAAGLDPEREASPLSLMIVMEEAAGPCKETMGQWEEDGWASILLAQIKIQGGKKFDASFCFGKKVSLNWVMN